jgi:hypothetical protein
MSKNNTEIINYLKRIHHIMDETKARYVDKITYVNIDSRHRNKHPNNVVESNLNTLTSDPITTTINSNEIKINIPNHTFAVNDKILIQNVIGQQKKLNSNIYLSNGFDYFIVYFGSHGIDTNYLNYQNNFSVKIELIEDIAVSDRFVDNVPINELIGYKDAILPSTVGSTPGSLTTDLSVTSDELSSNYFFVKLPYNFVSSSSLVTVSKIFKVTLMNIGNIPIQYINSNYPVNCNQYQGYQQITKIDTNNIYFNAKIKAYATLTSGGNDINVSKIIKTNPGYPNTNQYKIQLNNNFNNISEIKLISTEVPYVDFLVKSTGLNKNNMLYWQMLEDGDEIYSISIPEGSYNNNGLNLAAEIKKLMNSVSRVGSTLKNPLYNNFDIDMNYLNQDMSFISYRDDFLPDSITVASVTISSENYYQLTIVDSNNLAEVDDIITISGSTQINVVEESYINTSHTVYSVDKSTNSYTVLLNYVNASGSSVSGNGGQNIKIKYKCKFRLLFNYPFTIGNILGFKNVGDENSITEYAYEITNGSSYILSNNLDEVGNTNTTKNIFNINTNYRYILLYVNDWETIHTKGLNNSFAKINYYGDIGDILYNTFKSNSYKVPITTLSEIKVTFLNPDGTFVDFRNLENSFTLQITKRVFLNDSSLLTSKYLNYDTIGGEKSIDEDIDDLIFDKLGKDINKQL